MIRDYCVILNFDINTKSMRDIKNCTAIKLIITMSYFMVTNYECVINPFR